MVSWETKTSKAPQTFHYPALVSVKKFAWLPTRAENGRVYWLESLYYQYELIEDSCEGYGGPWSDDKYCWTLNKISGPPFVTNDRVIVHGSPGQDNQSVPNTEGA